jgi:peptide deformylase
MRLCGKEEKMAIRNIRIENDEILRKKCREITEMTPKLRILIDDMLETMYEASGVGLAAPQVGILRRIVVIDVGDEHGPIVLVNPVILETSGSQTGGEGCLSIPGKTATVTRPNYAKVKGFDRDMNEIVIEGTGLLARAICHECDHLEGVLYIDKAESEVMDTDKYYGRDSEEQEQE